MDRSGLIKLLEHQTREIELLVKGLEKSQSLHRIEVDLLLSKIRSLYEEAYLLHTQYQDPPEIENIIIPEPVKSEPEPAMPVPEPPLVIIPEPLQRHDPVEPPTPELDPGLNPFLNPLFDTPVTFREVIEQAPVERREVITKKADPVVSAPIETQHAASPAAGAKKASSVNEMPVADLFDAVGLNDRFLFTRELFSNSNEIFRTTLQSLNQAGSSEKARNLLKERFDWDEKDPVVQSFMALVERRFLSK